MDPAEKEYIDKLREENRQLRKQNEEYASFISAFDDDLINEIRHIDEDSRAGMSMHNPDNHYIYGDYTVFCSSSSSKKYHEKYGCSDAFTAIHRATMTEKRLTPCKKCCGKFSSRAQQRTPYDYNQLSRTLSSLKSLVQVNHTPEYVPKKARKKPSGTFIALVVVVLIIVAVFSNRQEEPTIYYADIYGNLYVSKSDAVTGSNRYSGFPSSKNSSASNNPSSSMANSKTSDDENPYLYVLNTSTKKIHEPTCPSVKQIADKNYATWEGESASDFITDNPKYSRCQRCDPK